MRITILTLFPEMIDCWLKESIIGRARTKGVITIDIKNLRDWSQDKHRTVDDRPYGGGPGMLIKVDVVDRALAELRAGNQNIKTVLLTPQGKRFSQVKAEELSHEDDLVLIAGHYEGFDERIRQLVDLELSIGDFVLTGGEIAAAAITDAVIRLLPGVLGDHASSSEESFTLTNEHGERLIEYPQYTRPEDYRPLSQVNRKNMSVPQVLLSGNHREITKWRLEEAKKNTKRP